MVSCCLWPGGDDDGNLNDDEIPYFWEREISDHHYGHFSMAVLQSNRVIEDKCQVEVAEDGSVFCGVYDGHGGFHASTYVLNNLYPNFRGLVENSGMISGYTLLNAFVDTENGFLDTVQREVALDPTLARCGSCCLAGILTSKRVLHYANLGNCRAVLGYIGYWGNIQTEQLTQDHNVSDKRIREEYEASQPGRKGAVVKVNGKWRVNGCLTVSSCIGDGTFKRDNLAMHIPPLHVRNRFHRPLLNAVPSVQARQLCATDRFVIFATDGLWEILSNEKAAQVVHNGPREGAAKRLIKKALRMRADELQVTYDSLKTLRVGNYKRRRIDDISVIVLFLDDELLVNPRNVPAYSVKGFEKEPDDWIDLVDAAGDLFA